MAVETRFNFAESILHWLPIKWSRWLSCQIGEKWPDCDEAQKQPQSPQNKRCQFFLKINRQRGHQCHVNRFSIFTFRLEVKLQYFISYVYVIMSYFLTGWTQHQSLLGLQICCWCYCELQFPKLGISAYSRRRCSIRRDTVRTLSGRIEARNPFKCNRMRFLWARVSFT